MLSGVSIITSLIIALVIIVGLFLIFRKIVLWYYKIDLHIVEQKKQTALLQQIADKLTEPTKE